MLALNILVICVILLICKYYWLRRRFYYASWRLPGALAFPFVGASWIFWDSPSEVVLKVANLVHKYGTPFGFWLGTRFIIYLSKPDHAEIVINSSNSMDKGGVYQYVQELIGGPGLFSLGGDLWKMHRRLLNPTVQNTKILNSFYPYFNENIKILIENLSFKDGKSIFNIYGDIEACSFDMFCKTTFGVDLNIQKQQNLNILKTVNDALGIVSLKIFQPWYQFEPLFKASKYHNIKVKSTSDMRSFIKGILEKRLLELSGTTEVTDVDDFGEKRLRIFIDEIIKLSIEEKCFSEDEMISESLTMLLAGYETSAVTVSNIIVMLAMHPEYQEKVFQEIHKICPDGSLDVTAEDLKQLDYTDRFIKETMRLIPTVPFTTRIAKADFNVDKIYVPAGTELILSVFSLQRDKSIWGDDAEEFNPDHFLPENAKQTHAYSFIPFSMGSRNCIGKKYAEIVVRMFVVHLVRNYVFSTDMKLENLKYNWMIVMKLKNGYRVKIAKRQD